MLTPEILKRVIDQHNGSEVARLNKLEKYYLTKNEILNRQMADPFKPNNKVANPYASYITDTLTGYFIGEPVSYTSAEEGALEELTAIFNYNDEQDENMELAKDASIFGVGYELLYIDETGSVRFKNLNPKECIPVYDDSVEEELLYFIRYYKSYDIVTDKYFYNIEVLSKTSISSYTANDNLGGITFVQEVPHFFTLVPVAIYTNNEYQTGDFEQVIGLIDAYDKMESDTLNDFEYFCDAYLALYGFTAEPEDIKEMKENRVLLMDHDTKAEWLIKDNPDITIENMKNRLDADIHRFAKCPNLLDESFAGNSSGVAIKYKMIGTENLTSIKERKFKKGLQKRIELISYISTLKTGGFDWRSIDINFTRNLPVNDAEIANMVSTLEGIVSNETLLSQISFVEDVNAELDKIKKQKEENPLYNNPVLMYEDGFNNQPKGKDNKEVVKDEEQ